MYMYTSILSVEESKHIVFYSNASPPPALIQACRRQSGWDETRPWAEALSPITWMEPTPQTAFRPVSAGSGRRCWRESALSMTAQNITADQITVTEYILIKPQSKYKHCAKRSPEILFMQRITNPVYLVVGHEIVSKIHSIHFFLLHFWSVPSVLQRAWNQSLTL